MQLIQTSSIYNENQRIYFLSIQMSNVHTINDRFICILNVFTLLTLAMGMVEKSKQWTQCASIKRVPQKNKPLTM